MTANTLTITTLKGASVKLDGGATGGTVSADINGKPHTSFGVELGHDNVIGHHLVLAGKARAQVSENDAAAVREFFRVQATRLAAAKSAYKLTSPEASAKMSARMYGRHSDC